MSLGFFFFVSWSRLGFVVPLIIVVAFIASATLFDALHVNHALVYALGLAGLLAGPAIGLFAHFVYDEAGSFFWLPTRHWAIAAPIIGLALCGFSLMNGDTPEADQTTIAAPAS